MGEDGGMNQGTDCADGVHSRQPRVPLPPKPPPRWQRHWWIPTATPGQVPC